MKIPILFFAFCLLLQSGCRTPPPAPTYAQRSGIVMEQLYRMTRIPAPRDLEKMEFPNLFSGESNDAFLFSLYYPPYIENDDLVPSVEKIFLAYAQSKDPDTLWKVIPYLCALGTEETLAKAISFAVDDEDPELRVYAWGCLLELLASPEWVLAPDVKTEDVSGFLTNPNLLISVSNCGGRLPYSVKPLKEARAQSLVDLALNRFAEDDGIYAVQYVDQIPFLPFLKSEGEYTISVRDEIFEGLIYLPDWFSEQVQTQMNTYLTHENEQISQAAEKFFRVERGHSCPSGSSF